MITIVHELRKAKGSNKKIEILKRHSDNSTWKKALTYMYDTSINYYISAPKDQTFKEDGEVKWDNMFTALDSLRSGQLRGNMGKQLALASSEMYGEMFRLILKGSLESGVGVTSINKAYPGLIPTFKVMKAEDVPVTIFPVYGSTKFDGIRAIATVSEGVLVSLQTSEGKEMIVESLQSCFKDAPNGVYDGELVSGDGKQAGRTKITGQVNKILLGTATDLTDYMYVVFDRVGLYDWERQTCIDSYEDRIKYAATAIGLLSRNYHVTVAEQKELFSQEDIDELYRDRIAKGYEGLILRYKDDPYVWARSSMLIKKKAKYEFTLTCMEVQEGEGKYTGMVGALICEGMVKGKLIRVKVGTGFSDFDRDQPFDYYIGKGIEGTYNDIVRAEKSEIYSLFLPVFKRVVGGV